MERTTSTGWGQTKSPISEEWQIWAQNQPITHKEMMDYVNFLINTQYDLRELSKWRIFIGKELKRKWGTCFYKRKEIIINRCSLGTFIHELAHAIDVCKRSRSNHDWDFNREYTWTVKNWKHDYKLG